MPGCLCEGCPNDGCGITWKKTATCDNDLKKKGMAKDVSVCTSCFCYSCWAYPCQCGEAAPKIVIGGDAAAQIEAMQMRIHALEKNLDVTNIHLQQARAMQEHNEDEISALEDELAAAKKAGEERVTALEQELELSLIHI